jgi:hypothetical protein
LAEVFSSRLGEPEIELLISIMLLKGWKLTSVKAMTLGADKIADIEHSSRK